jgi:ketosteroid isomerase-like protein
VRTVLVSDIGVAMPSPIVRLMVALACAALSACATPPRVDPDEAKAQVFATERAFAKSMADRDYAAFTSFLAPDAVFFSGPEPRRGKQAVADAWKRFFDKPQAPFSWEPERVEVLDSGTLALSTGPVRDPGGKLIATFTSIWRLEAPGVWRIVFDKGNDVCDCTKSP